jgi:hypothetical protein
MSALSFPAAIERLNQVSRERWGDQAPRYTWVSYRCKNQPRTYLVHQIDPQPSPWLPADRLVSRGPRDHCLAYVRSAIRHATS